MAIRHGSIRLSPQDTAIREKFKHTMQCAIERIGKADANELDKEKCDNRDDYVQPWTYKGKNYLRSSTNEIWTDNPGNGASGLGEWCGIYFPGEDCIYSGYEEPEFDATSEEKNNTKELILQSEPISMLQVDDILGMDRVEKEDHRRLQAEWKSKEAMLWNKIVDQENTIRAFQKQEKEWQTAAMKHADEIIASHDTDQVEFDIDAELDKMFASWFTYYEPPKNIEVNPSIMDSIKKIIKLNTDAIAKNETIKVVVYQSYEIVHLDAWNNRAYETYAYHVLVTTDNVYQLRHFTNGSMSPFVRCAELNIRNLPSVTRLPYGESYQWVKLCKTPHGVQWRSLREFSHGLSGNVNIECPVAHQPVIHYKLKIERTFNAFYAMLGVNQCKSIVREPYRPLPPGQKSFICMIPCDGEVCSRHMPFTTTILSNEHVIEGTNIVVDITTSTVVGWVDKSKALQFNCKNHEEHLVADKYDLHRANEEERIEYSKRQK